mgnify:CR=1 FL=1
MNIKLKAGLQTAGFVASTIGIVILTCLAMDYLESKFGIEAVKQGAVLFMIVGAIGVMVSVVYDIRLHQLKYKQKLEEFTRK